jgi:hypothetical protein
VPRAKVLFHLAEVDLHLPQAIPDLPPAFALPDTVGAFL